MLVAALLNKTTVVLGLVLLLGLATWKYALILQWLSKLAIGVLEAQMEKAPRGATAALARMSQGLKRFHGKGLLTQSGREALSRCEVALAIEDYKGKNWQESLNRLKLVRKLHDRAIDQYRWLVKYYMATGRANTEAVDCYCGFLASREAGQAGESLGKVKGQLKQACSLQPGLDEEEIKERISWSRKAQTVMPEESWPRLNEVRGWVMLGKYKRAEDVLDEAGPEVARTFEARLLQFRILAAQGDRNGARRVVEALKKEGLEGALARLELARVLVTLGELQEAEALLSPIAAENSEAATELALLKVRRLMGEGREAEAIEALKEEAYSRPEDTRIALLLAELHSRQGAADKALKVLRRAIPKDTEDPALQFVMGCAHVNIEKYDEADNWFERCDRVGFRPKQVFQQRVRCLSRQGRQAELAKLVSVREKGEETAEIAFYRGVCLYRSGSPDKALPHFARAFNLAKAKGDRDLMQRCRLDSCACYYSLGRQLVEQGKFLHAAKSYETLLGWIKPEHAHYGLILQDAVECFVRAAIELLKDGDPAKAKLAIQHLEKAVSLGAKGQARVLLAGVYFDTQQYDSAYKIYDDLLRASPDSKSLKFTHALAGLRSGRTQQARDELGAVLAEEGPLSLRAALALATEAVARKQYDEAVDLLLKVAHRESSRKNKYYGEVVCNTVLFSIRAGKVEQAKRLSRELMGGEKTVSADVLVGSLLADDGDLVGALPFLESGIPDDGRRTSHSLLLGQVYRRVAHKHCQDKKFEEAEKVLLRANRREKDPKLEQYLKLVKAAREGGSKTEVDRVIVSMLDELYHSVTQPEPIIVWATAVAHHRLAYQQALGGKPENPDWKVAHSIWKEQIAKKGGFWSQFIQDYDKDKKYKLELPPGELETVIQKNWTGLCIAFCGAFLEGRNPQELSSPQDASVNGSGPPQLNLAKFFWQEAVNLTGKEKALALFREVVDLNVITGKLDVKKQPKRVFELYKFVYDQIDKDPKYKTMLGNMALEQAVDALWDRKVSEFMSNLDLVASANSELSGVVRNVRSMGTGIVTSIVNKFHSHAGLADLRNGNPSAAKMVLLQVVFIFANTGTQVPGGINQTHVQMLFEQVVVQVIQNMGGK